MQRNGFRTNFIINLGGAASALLVTLATVPLFVGQIGAARYGVLSIIWILLGTMGFLDLGLSRAATNALARIDHDDKVARERIFLTALCMNFVMGLLGAAALLVGGLALFAHVISLPPEILPEVNRALPWVAGLLPLALMNGVGIGSLESRDHFLAANLLQLAGTLAIQIVPLLCALAIGPRLEIVVPAAVLSRAASVVLVIGFAWRYERSGRMPHLDRTTTTNLLRYGSWVSVSNIISPLLISLDQMVLGAVLGVAAVTFYAVPFSLVMKSQIFAAAVSRTLFPRMSRETERDAQQLARRAVGGLSYSYGAICLAGVLLMRPFVTLWMGPQFAAVAVPLGQIFLLGAWFNGLAFIPFELLQAQGRPHLSALLHVIEIGPFFAVLWYLTHKFGLTGAAVAWVLRMAIDSLLFFLVSRHGARATLRLLPVALILLAALLFVHVMTLSLLATVVCAAAGVGLILALGFVLDETTRVMVVQLRTITLRLIGKSRATSS
jgi:O-antigen/teichoic acid export membrane protein